MSLLSKLFGGGGGGSGPKVTSETYEGFTITPTPIREGTVYRVSAKIEKDGQEHTLIRADTINDAEEAVLASIRKAKQVIDEQGDRLFRG